MERSFTIDQIPVYMRAGAIVPMQPAMLHTGEKPVDPLIVNVWPLKPGQSSSYSVYEDSGVSVEYQKGVFARTPIKATENGDTLRVEIGPVEGVSGNAEDAGLRGAAAGGLAAGERDGERQSCFVRRAGRAGRMDIRGQYADDGDSGAERERGCEGGCRGAARAMAALRGALSWMDLRATMTRLRGVEDALQQTGPVAGPSIALRDAMQTGDLISYYPERIDGALKHFHEQVAKANADVAQLDKEFEQRLSDTSRRIGGSTWAPADIESEKQKRRDALHRAEALLEEVAK